MLPGANDLASRRPDLAAQWHPAKNGPLTAEQVLAGSHRSVWWVCEKGHEWRAMVKSRASGCGCPVCAGREKAARQGRCAAMENGQTAAMTVIAIPETENRR